MFANTKATNGFAVDDIEAAKRFYGETLGLGTTDLSEEFGVMSIQLAGGRDTLVYRKDDFAPATRLSSCSRSWALCHRPGAGRCPVACYLPAASFSKRGLPRSGSKPGSIFSQPGER